MKTSTYPENRLFCLDLLRGLDMFYLAVVGGAILPAIFNGWHLWSPETNVFLTGHPWFGFSAWDLIMPLFIFMSGAAVPFALGKRLDAEGRPTAAYWGHVASRFALLWVLGMLSQGRLTTFSLHKVTIYSNTLQTIAIGYLAAAIVYPIRAKAARFVARWLFPLALLIAYALIVHLNGDYTKDGNIAQRFDLAVWGKIYPADHEELAYIKTYGYVWLLPSFMFPVLTLAGCYSTELLRNKVLAPYRKALILLVAAVVCWFVGKGLDWGLGIKTCKHIFTVSFTLQAIAWSILLLDALYVLTDIWKLRRGLGLFIVFGQFALTAYLCECAFRGIIYTISDRFLHGIRGYLPAEWSQLVAMIGFSVVTILVVYARRAMKSR